MIKSIFFLKTNFFSRAKVRLGEHRISTDPDCLKQTSVCNDSPQDFDVEEIVFHQDYGVPQVFRNDIALLRLSRPANFSGLLHTTYNISITYELGIK